MRQLIVILPFLAACVHVPSVRSVYPITTEEPTETVDEAVASQGDPVDESTLAGLPNQDAVGLMPGSVAPFPGILISEREAARYRLVDAAADRWLTDYTVATWRLARTERRDATNIEALERRIDLLAPRAERRRRWMYVFLGLGFAAGVGTAVGISAATD